MNILKTSNANMIELGNQLEGIYCAWMNKNLEKYCPSFIYSEQL